MDKLDKIDLEVKEKIESADFTPETLAWTLITDESCEKIKNGKLLFFSDQNGLNLEEQTENKFQILLTIYFELIFGWYKLLHLMQNEMDETDTEFKPDLSSITIDDLTKEFVDKFKILGFILHVKEITNDELYIEENAKCYCKVLLRDSPLDSNYFFMKRYQLDPEKRYTFVRNGKFQLTQHIRKYTAIARLPTRIFKISFMHFDSFNSFDSID
jgi:hypothetical protein